MDDTLFQEGLEIRREVNGEEAIDALFDSADDFSRPMQEFVTTFCWGAVWGRPGLDRRSRSILTIGMLASANRPQELAGHIRAGLVNGLSTEEIREILLQVAIYMGMPAGLSAFKVAQQVLSERQD